MTMNPFLPWLLPIADIGEQVRAARAIGDPGERFARLRALAQHPFTFAETLSFDRALTEALAALPAKDRGVPELRLAWLCSSTTDHLVPSARVAALRRGLLLESYTCGYGQHRQEALEPPPELVAFRPKAVLFGLDPFEGLPTPRLDASATEVDEAVRAWVDELRGLWDHAREAHGAIVLQQTIPNVQAPLFGFYEHAVPAAPTHVTDTLNHALADAAVREGVLVLDLDGWAARAGHEAWFPPARWHHAKQLVAPALAPLYGEFVARCVGAAVGASKKVLVLDLDNTVWGGVIGDEGVDGIVLGPGSAAGEAHLAFQRFAKGLAERGVILAVCSKNTPSIAEEAFRRHPEMVLRPGDIAAFYANWDDKPQNLRRIAEELNVGLDALVLVDDNPVERALVRAELPMVGVPELPEDVAGYARRVSDAGYFDAASFTVDDRKRARQYEENAQREQSRVIASDVNAFLRGLEMHLEVAPFDDASFVRIVQLINKTNQFNVTTRRYTEAELRAAIAAPGVVHFSARLKDRFGDNGLIAVVLAKPGERAGEQLIDTWLMSCRVLGRGVEQETLNVLVNAAKSNGVHTLVGEYRPTAKNGIVRDLFERLGFSALPAAEGGAALWKLSLADFERRPNHIRTTERTKR
jgi:FkbH-like protein